MVHDIDVVSHSVCQITVYVVRYICMMQNTLMHYLFVGNVSVSVRFL